MQEHGIMLYKLGYDFTKIKVIILCQQTMKRKPLKVSLRVKSRPRTAAGEKKDGCIYSEKALLSK